jgi:hypothetical protein
LPTAFASVAFSTRFDHLAAMQAIPLAAKLLLIVIALLASGCVTPLTFEQESDWRWKQYNPEYRSPWPPDPGLGAH